MRTFTHYETLGIPADASSERVKQAYRSLVKAFHPDMFPMGSEAQIEAGRRIREINMAYSVLSHPLKRATYDATLQKNVADAGLAPARCSRCGKPTLSWQMGKTEILCKGCEALTKKKEIARK